MKVETLEDHMYTDCRHVYQLCTYACIQNDAAQITYRTRAQRGSIQSHATIARLDTLV